MIYMPTIKLKRKLRKSRKNNRMSKRDTMKRGGIKHAREESDDVEAEKKPKTQRGKTLPEIYDIRLGNGQPTSPSYGLRQFSAEEINDFVKKTIIHDFQKLSFPTTPQSHNILVIKEPGIIRIVDWNNTREVKTEVDEDHEEDKEDGTEYKINSGYEAGKEGLGVDETTRKSNLQKKKKLTKKEKDEIEDIEKKEEDYIKWRQYTILIDAIKTNYPEHEVIFEKVIRKLRKQSFEKLKSCHMGGCSEYIDLWLKNRYPDGHRIIPYEYKFKHM